jgi:hypothetical protein
MTTPAGRNGAPMASKESSMPNRFYLYGGLICWALSALMIAAPWFL